MHPSKESNFSLFRDILSTPLISKSEPVSKPHKTRRRNRSGQKSGVKAAVSKIQDEPNDAEDLAEFIDYIAQEIFTSLPENLQTLTYTAYINTIALQTGYPNPLPKPRIEELLNSLSTTITDSLLTYDILPVPPSPTTSDIHSAIISFLTIPLQSYVATILTPPPPPSSTKVDAKNCEICERDWIPLSYHHLIPRSVHEKVLKKGWHTEDQLNNVAWLCRACHSFVHRSAPNEELAKNYYTVERLLERDDIKKFGEWIGRVRWRSK